MTKHQHIKVLAGLVAFFGASPSNSVGNSFSCDSSMLGSLTINMNFGEWFDEIGNRGEVRFGKKKNTYELDYKGTDALLTHRGNKSQLLFSDGSIITMSCTQGGSGQTPGP